MSAFPACKHRIHRTKGPTHEGLRWLASEPYRLFFASGAVWSIIGVALWPLFYAQYLGFYPNVMHARLMIEAFGGAFVVGFLGTAGPRMATAPKLTPLELLLFFGLHQASAICHLKLLTHWGDALFVAMLGCLMAALVVRVLKFRKEAPPPQMLLALVGLGCGIVGASMLISQRVASDPAHYRLAGLLLYQGMLLPPVLGIGSFVFPRMLGGDFGEAKTAAQVRAKLLRASLAAVAIVLSFFVEVKGAVGWGYGLRAATSLIYLTMEVGWRPAVGDSARGSLTTGLYWAMGLGFAGLALTSFLYQQHISVEHLLYIGGFGLLILVVSSRVLFGHSGDLDGFFVRSRWVRFLVFLAVLAAITRATPAWVPSTTVSHHIYAAWTWGLLALLWLIWHRRRFGKRDDS